MLLERRRRLRADALRGAVGGAELGMLDLELLQLAKQAVVLGVGHLRLVEYVVSVVGALDEPPQLRGSCRKTLHRPFASSLMTATAPPTSPSSSSAQARGRG